MGLEKINLFRREKGLSVEELSKLSGVPLGTLSKITAGITKNPNLETVKAIVSALGLTLDDLEDPPLNSKLKIMNDSFDYFIERQMLLLGYEVISDSEDGYLCLIGKEGTFEISEIQLNDLRGSIKSYLKFKIQELIENSHQIEQKSIPKPHLLPNAAHEIKGSSKEDRKHDEDIMDDENF